MEKISVYLEAEAYRRLKELARKRGRHPARMIREAVEEYIARHAPQRMPRSIGAFKSGRKNFGSRAEELLGDFGDER